MNLRPNFWTVFRLVFVFFFLYLIGDAFYRWDGFSYHGSFSEFLPAFALASILWSVIAFLCALFIWILLLTLRRILLRVHLKITIDQLLLCTGFFVVLSSVALGAKKLAWPLLETAMPVKIGTLISVVLLSVALALLFREKAGRWIEIAGGRVTPLVWLFGITVLMSVPLVSYSAFHYTGKLAVTGINAGHVAPAEGRPNILFITFDALTARDMSLYGFNKETTPFMSRWAQSATVFTRLEGAANYTAPTTATLMTGKRVWTHRRFQSNAGAPVHSATESLPFVLINNGYFNMAFVANSIASVQELGMSESFSVAPGSYEFISPARLFGYIHKYLYKGFGAKIKLNDWILYEDFILDMVTPDPYIKEPYRSEFPIEKVFDRFQEEMKGTVQEPYFAWNHVFPPHFPYLPPDEEAGLFDPSTRYTSYGDQFKLVRPRYFPKEHQHDADILRSRYDEFIRYCDGQFKSLIEEMESRGELKNTVIIVSSDHGESFSHGYFTHGGPYLFEQMTHLPLIIKVPGQTEGNVIDTLVGQADIPATILDLAGIPVPSWMEGRSLVPLFRKGKIEPRPVFSMNLNKNPSRERITKGSIAVWEGDYKLIHYLGKKQSLLFNLKEDPGELHNLMDKEPDVGGRLLGMIQDRLEKVNYKYAAVK